MQSAATQDLDCTQGATMALTIVAGPLNYVGPNPKISCERAGSTHPTTLSANSP
jgi:hypothetical protein